MAISFLGILSGNAFHWLLHKNLEGFNNSLINGGQFFAGKFWPLWEKTGSKYRQKRGMKKYQKRELL